MKLNEIKLDHIKNHFSQTSKSISELQEKAKLISSISNMIVNCNRKKGKILVAGNGGSHADADHFTGELICTFHNRNRPGLNAKSLMGSGPAVSAWSNDFNFHTFLKREVEFSIMPGDILFLLSTGGGSIKLKTSINLIYAAQVAKKKGAKIISLVGKNGGYLKKISDCCIHIKSQNTAIIQESHMSILHAICIDLDRKL